MSLKSLKVLKSVNGVNNVNIQQLILKKNINYIDNMFRYLKNIVLIC